MELIEQYCELTPVINSFLIYETTRQIDVHLDELANLRMEWKLEGIPAYLIEIAEIKLLDPDGKAEVFFDLVRMPEYEEILVIVRAYGPAWISKLKLELWGADNHGNYCRPAV